MGDPQVHEHFHNLKEKWDTPKAHGCYQAIQPNTTASAFGINFAQGFDLTLSRTLQPEIRILRVWFCSWRSTLPCNLISHSDDIKSFKNWIQIFLNHPTLGATVLNVLAPSKCLWTGATTFGLHRERPGDSGNVSTACEAVRVDIRTRLLIADGFPGPLLLCNNAE